MFRLLICSVLIFSVACTKKSEEKQASNIYYTCSMHPEVREHEHGKCPICNMDLVAVEIDRKGKKLAQTRSPSAEYYCKDFPEVKSKFGGPCPVDGTAMIRDDKGPEKSNLAKVVAQVKLKKAHMNHFKPEFFPVARMNMVKKIRLLGNVLRSEEKESRIAAKVDGRVEKVFVRSTGSSVSLGDPVLTLYSPKLITAGEEYLVARRSFNQNNSVEFRNMLNQSRERLRLWGIKQFQYDKWFRDGRVPRQIVIYSDATGVVRKRNAVVGKYFTVGQNFFELSNLDDVWVEMDVYEHDSFLVKVGQKAELSFDAIPGEKLQGVIDFINPVLDPKSRTLKIRATIPNSSGKLKPGMLANAVLIMNIPGNPLAVPRNAIIDTGKRKVVWIKPKDKEDGFLARAVQTGYESDGYVEIKSGLSIGESVVIEGNFLLDAQAQLFGGYEDITD